MGIGAFRLYLGLIWFVIVGFVDVISAAFGLCCCLDAVAFTWA